MVTSLLGRGYGWWWDHPYFFEGPFGGDGHFIFVEETEPFPSDQLLDPRGDAIARDSWRGDLVWRFRSSGIGARPFLDAMDRIEPLDHNQITLDQRQRRRGQLREEFGRTPLPTYDLYVEDKSEEAPFLRAMLAPGTWLFVTVRERDEDDQRLPIYVGAPELDPGPYAPGSLEILESVPLSIEYRLRDIFSLAHVPDVDIEEDELGTDLPPDGPDFRPDEEKRRRTRALLKLREKYERDGLIPGTGIEWLEEDDAPPKEQYGRPEEEA